MKGRRLWAAGVIGVLAWVSGGCEGGSDGAPRPPEIRDSAGVRVVFSPDAQWAEGEAWRMANEPELVIGHAALEAEPEYALHRVSDAVRLGDGRILVAQSGEAAGVRLFGPDGRFLRTLGGPGEGPGEFRLVGGICVAGDTVVVEDALQGRLTELGLDGEVLRTSAIDQMANEYGLRGGAVVWFSPFFDCDFLGRPNYVGPDSTGTALWPFLRLDRTTLAEDTVFSLEAGEYVEQNGRVREVAFSSFPIAAAGAAVAFLSVNNDMWVQQYSKDGRLLRRFGRAFKAVEITRRDRDQMDSVWARRSATGEAPERQFASHWPVHTAMVADRVGNLWLRHFRKPFVEEPAWTWTVFDTAGVLLGEVELPSELRVFEIGSDYVLGVWRDSLDVETVRLFPLDKPLQ